MTRVTLPEPLLFQVYSLIVASAIGLAAVIFTSGAFAGDVFRGGELRGPRDLVEWVPYTSPELLWGLVFLLVGGLLIWGIQKSWAIYVMRFAMVIYVFLALSFVTSVGTSAISWMAAVFALTLAAMHLVLSVRIDVYGWK